MKRALTTLAFVVGTFSCTPAISFVEFPKPMYTDFHLTDPYRREITEINEVYRKKLQEIINKKMTPQTQEYYEGTHCKLLFTIGNAPLKNHIVPEANAQGSGNTPPTEDCKWFAKEINKLTKHDKNLYFPEELKESGIYSMERKVVIK